MIVEILAPGYYFRTIRLYRVATGGTAKGLWKQSTKVQCLLRRTHRWDTILDLVTHCITDTVALMPKTKVVVLTPSSYHNIKQKPLDLPQKRRKSRPQGGART